MLAEMIGTLERIVGSNPLWQKVSVLDNGLDSPRPACEDVGPSAEDLAEHADEAFGAFGDQEPLIPPQRPEPTQIDPATASQAPRRVRIIALMSNAPQRWWSALDLCAELGVDGHRKLRGILSDMVRAGQLIKHKESGRKNVYYRLAPEFAQQQEATVSG
ncbi:hypothetical protein ABZW18_33520 [Streptomyces sp. NPDC004647]|uniref:hypothetical protein n=1 Tax=Streptomyces sp. NPDC004647 TaxID=3154671 RepID=UPI0033B66E2B